MDNKQEPATRGDNTRARLGPYEIIGEIGAGGMSKVYKAYHPQLDRIVALKVLLESENLSERGRNRFVAEAQAAGKLRHANIVPIHDVGCIDGKNYLVMEFIDGDPLSQLFKHNRIPQRKLLELMREVALAVDYAHANGIVHRDLKPDNIMVERDTGKGIVMDFGLAKNIKSGKDLTKTGEVLGTPRYMAPEQAKGIRREISPRTDVYALGAILYEGLTGSPAIDGSTSFSILYNLANADIVPARRRNPHLPVELETICMKAMEKDARQRYPSARMLADDIDHYLNGEPIWAKPCGIVGRSWKKIKRHRLAVSLVTLSLAMCTGIGIWLVDRLATATGLGEREIGRRLDQIRSALQNRQYQLALEQSRQTLAAYPDHSQAHTAYLLQAQAQQGLGQAEAAFRSYQELYLQSSLVAHERQALHGIIEHLLRRGKYAQARAIASTLWPDQQAATNLELWLAARVCFHCGDWQQAQALLMRIEPAQMSAYDQESYVRYRHYLQQLTPISRFSCDAGNVHLLSLDRQANIPLVAVAQARRIDIYRFTPQGLQRDSQVLPPAGHSFCGKVWTGNLLDNGEKQLAVLLQTGPSERDYHLGVFVETNREWRAVHVQPLESAALQIWVGKLWQSTQDVVVVAMGHYRRNSFILLYQKKQWRMFDIDPQQRLCNTDYQCVDAGDLDGDACPELVFGSGPWTFFDVRVYRLQQKQDKVEWHMQACQRLGSVDNCLLADLDGDGRKEILASKRYTRNCEVFGNANPHGSPDGVYVFSYADGRLQPLWQHAPVVANLRREFYHLAAGRLKKEPLAVVQCANIWEENGKQQSACETWLVKKRNGQYEAVYFQMPGMSSPVVGDVNGDGNGELIFCRDGQLWICGME